MESSVVEGESEVPMDSLTPILGDAGRLSSVWRTGIVWLSWLVAAVSAAGQWVLLAVADQQGDVAKQALPTDVSLPLLALVLASFGTMVVMRGDAPGYGWLMLATGVTFGVIGFAGQYSLFAREASVPFAAAAVWIQDLWLVPWMLVVLLLPALFPSGEAASARWRLPVRLATTLWVVFIVVFALIDRPATNLFLDIDDPPANQTGFLPISEAAYAGTWVVLSFSSIVIGIGSLLARWQQADSELRQRFKWVIYSFGVILVVTALELAAVVLDEALGLDLGLAQPLGLLTAAAVVGLAVSLGFAVLRFRLYDVDLVINRTIVYGVLTAIIVTIYIGVVVGAGSLLPVQQSILALVITGVVAVAFAPLRTWMQGSVNRLMFGQRHDPYAVLSEMGRLLARSGAPDEIAQTLCETLANSLKLPWIAIELEQDGAFETWARYGDRGGTGVGGFVVPLRDQGEAVGRLVVGTRSPRDPLSPEDKRLLEDIAHQTGALARSVRLMTALQRSRERFVLGREEERRRIRRDLHDRLGPSLASQMFQLEAVLDHLEDDPSGAAALVAALKEQNKQLVADIRRLVYELRPPALDELGVAGALSAHVSQFERSTPLTIEINSVPDPLPALPAAVEVAAYRIAREAISNTLRHAGASRCTATLEVTDSTLTIAVCDDGLKMGGTVRPGVGMTSMRERTEELGGILTIATGDPTGTTVFATLPLINRSRAESSMSADTSNGNGGPRG
ncbi:MAG: histidine kinase [Actinomycetota bacterium]